MPILTESTTFTRDVLGRYICSTWHEATADPERIDVVVIGAGMYGGYCAAKVYQESRFRSFPRAMEGSRGPVCPHAAHIFKVNPRDRATNLGPDFDTLTRWIFAAGFRSEPLLAACRTTASREDCISSATKLRLSISSKLIILELQPAGAMT
jgi:hypothetical protein